jgi:hypothetical protein
MKTPTVLKATLIGSLAVVLMLPAPLSAQSPRGGGIFGDWLTKIESGRRQNEVILWIFRDADGNLAARHIGPFGLSELTNVVFEAGKLSYERVSRNQAGQTFRAEFSGTVQDGRFSGTTAGSRVGGREVTGVRQPRIPRVVGTWALKLKMDDREFTSKLILGADPEGTLTAQWESEWGEHAVRDVQYRRRQLTFNRKSKMQEREWESTFEGTVQGNTLTGTIKSNRGELVVEGERIGGALIGTWMLDVARGRGNLRQRLVVNGDMSGLYGTIPIKKVTLENDRVSFAMAPQFGDRTVEMNFDGRLEEGKLSGELTSSERSQKVTGTKLLRTFGRRSNQ